MNKNAVKDMDPQDWTQNAPDAVLVCRSQGHDFPELDPRKPVSGIVTVQLSDGSLQLRFPCRRCRLATRKITTLPDRTMDRWQKYSYSYKKSYKGPRGVTGRTAFNEVIQRSMPRLLPA
jgi:hypothetical protein